MELRLVNALSEQPPCSAEPEITDRPGNQSLNEDEALDFCRWADDGGNNLD